MDGESPFDRMLTSLRGSLGRRIPGGLNDVADSRLHRTLTHYVKEVARVSGMIDEREILRETFDSMASWFRRNTDQLYSVSSSPPPRRRYAASAPPVIEHAVSPEPGGLGSVGGSAAPSSYDYDEDPLILFERMRAQRATMPLFAVPSAATPDLTAVETRRPGETAGAGAQPKDFLQPQEDIVKYRENEYNLVLNSKDRDWLVNTGQNRYNFGIILGSSDTEQGRTLNASLQTRLRNIVRIEFIKAILPVEGLDVVVGNDCSGSTPIGTDTNSFQSVLGLPFVQVTMDEIQGNNVTTNSEVDRSLAICQYDSTWRSDTITTTTRVNRGYTLFFPKFMKAQRIYAPTPLANLQKMTFTLRTPENQIISSASDSSSIKRILYSSDVSGGCYGENGYSAVPGFQAGYLFIETTTWFSQWAYLRPDRIKFAGLSFLDAQGVAGTLLRRWLEQEQGHTVIGIAHMDASSTPNLVADGPNDHGYANCIIIRHRFLDPTTSGAPSRFLFSGDLAGEPVFGNTVGGAGATGGVLNLNRQVQLFLRIVTRDMDAATNIRPDNV